MSVHTLPVRYFLRQRVLGGCEQGRHTRAAIEALRAHGNTSIERNLDAAAAIAALKAALPHGEFGRFCTDALQISSTYRARLLRLNDVRGHVREALAWAATQKHRFAECQSAQENLIRVVNDWLNKDRAPEPKSELNTQQGPRSKDIIAELEQVVAANEARERPFPEREFEVASTPRRCDRRPSATFGRVRGHQRRFATI